ncbi:MAG: hypothetical protein ACRC92_25910 [Peptostreptococcaceae bacterium]
MKKYSVEDRKIFLIEGHTNEMIGELHEKAENISAIVTGLSEAEGVVITPFGEELRIIDQSKINEENSSDSVFVDKRIFIEQEEDADNKEVKANYGINNAYVVEAPFESAKDLGEVIITNGDEMNPYADLSGDKFDYAISDRIVHLDILSPKGNDEVEHWTMIEQPNGEVTKHKQEFGIKDTIEVSESGEVVEE